MRIPRGVQTNLLPGGRGSLSNFEGIVFPGSRRLSASGMHPRPSASLLGSPSESGPFEQIAQMRAIARRGPQGAGLGEHQHRLAGTHPFQWNRLLKTIIVSLSATDASK